MDELERRIRAARPASGHRSLPLTDRAKRELAELVLSFPGADPSRARVAAAARRRTAKQQLTRRLVGVTTAVALTSSVALSVLGSQAYAVTPTPLVTTEIKESVHDVLGELEAVKQYHDSEAGSTIRVQTWELNTEVDGQGNVTASSIEPQWSETTFADDGSVRLLITAADPFPGQATEGLAPAGTVIADETLAPGEYISTYDEPVPTDSAEVGPYLAQYAGVEPPLAASTAIREISALLSSVILTSEQETAVISYLRTLDDLTLAGTVTDRLGRDGVAFQTTDPETADYTSLLILSLQTGSIIAAETIYVGSGRTDIDSPTVVDYTAWER